MEADERKSAQDQPKKKKKKRKSWVSTLILVLILIIGIGIIAYPSVSDWWNSFHQSRAIANYAAAVDNTDYAQLEYMLEQARAYNTRLLRKENRYVLSDEEKEEYLSLLDLSGTGIMGYIQIPSISVNLPLYHGTDESVLQVAIGHIEGTSLPVGGASTHSVVSGHRGLPSAKLFTDLDKMVEGDVFTMTILNETLTYEVDQIRIVEPSDMSNLNIVSGMDYCTLVTCTPYGINTHRLLVRGHRIENAAEEVVVEPDAGRIPSYLVVPAVAVPLLLLFLVGMLIYYSIRKARKMYTLEQLAERVKELAAAEEAEEQAAADDAETEEMPADGPETEAPDTDSNTIENIQETTESTYADVRPDEQER